ncbi:MAG: hypothetical protein J6D28_05390 [Bacilli bacterium]|nr:hypothetical protein [Bacilli bacterium]
MDKKDLNTNSTDIIVSGISAAVGMIPVAGGFVSEIVQNVIPNQREDRIVKFISDLSDELEKTKFSLEELKLKFENQKYSTFTYNCLRDLVNDVYDEKIEYYRNLCVNAITNDEKNLIHCERILKILSELDYYEILYLQFYSDSNAFGTKTTKDVTAKLGFDALQPTYYMTMDELKRDEETYKQITLNNLCNAGLLKRDIKLVGSGKREHISYKITILGRLILKKIGVNNNESE